MTKKLDITPEQESFCKRFIELAVESKAVMKRIAAQNFDEVYALDIGMYETEDSWDAILIVDGKPYVLYSYSKSEKERQPESNLESEVEELRNYLADKGVYV